MENMKFLFQLVQLKTITNSLLYTPIMQSELLNLLINKMNMLKHTPNHAHQTVQDTVSVILSLDHVNVISDMNHQIVVLNQKQYVKEDVEITENVLKETFVNVNQVLLEQTV